MPDPVELHAAILTQLSRVIDPETGEDVMRMRLVENLAVDDTGHVNYTFRPSSSLCPLAAPLALIIRAAVGQVPGVVAQTISVVNHSQAEQLTEWLNA